MYADNNAIQNDSVAFLKGALHDGDFLFVQVRRSESSRTQYVRLGFSPSRCEYWSLTYQVACACDLPVRYSRDGFNELVIKHPKRKIEDATDSLETAIGKKLRYLYI